MPKQFRATAILISLFSVYSIEAIAVEFGPNIVSIWGNDHGNFGTGLGRVNYMDTIGQQETLALSAKVVTTPPSPEGTIKAQFVTRAAIRKANGTWVAKLPKMVVASMPFPDPCDAENQVGGLTQTWYSSNSINKQIYPGQTECDLDIAEFYVEHGNFEVAVGSFDQERTLMFGLSIDGDYWNIQNEGEVSKFKFVSVDADDHSLLCSLVFPGTENDWDLAVEFSGVGPYLNPVNDVLRVAFEKEMATDGIYRYRYKYFNIRTCSLIHSKEATSPQF